MWVTQKEEYFMTARIQDDLYMAVNGAWQANTPIPADKAMVSADSELGDDIRATLVRDLTDIASGKKPAVNQPLQYGAKLYVKAADKAARDAAGVAPALPRLKYIESLTNLAAFKAALPELLTQQYATPFVTWVMADFHDATVNQLHLDSWGTILPDAALYREPSAETQEMFAQWSAMAEKLLLAAGYNATTAQAYIADALAFDQRIAALTPSNVEYADEKNLDNPYTWDELTASSKHSGLAAALTQLLPSTPAKVNLLTPGVFREADSLITDDNYMQLQRAMIVNELIDNASYLSDDLRSTAGAYKRFLSGQEAPTDWTRHAFATANSLLAEPIGLYYGQTYFGAEAKADITAMVKQLIAEYKRQLQANTWLSDATKQKAIAKLNTMKIKMGYPDQLFSMYAQLHFDDADDLLTALIKLQSQEQAFRLAQVGKPVDRSEWAMPGHLVNACYDPSKNDITFPAGILQPPYYALDWSTAAKLGGTGATIGHEISHCFDNNGSLYDENGSMNNWWTDADQQEFAKIVDAVAAQFDGREADGAKINGRLTVSENIADNAGMDVALQLLGKDTDTAALHEFFTAYAKSWATKRRPELAKTVALSDVHAPAILRVNVPVQNFTSWYAAYDVQPGDGMYMDPADRIMIWDK
jgi:putative endopeptidase